MALGETTCCRIGPQWSARWCVLAMVGGSLLAVGCGKEKYQLAPVKGQVTLDGRPRADVRVSFQPVSQRPDQPNPGPGSYGTTDAEGRYSLRTIEHEADGAVVGLHKVRLASKGPPQDPADDRTPAFKEIIPPQWRDGSKTFNVPPEGTDQANFHIRLR